MLVFALASPASAATAPVEPRQEPLVNCSQVKISLSQVRITCSAAGIVVLNTVLNLPQAPPITLPPIVGPTIRVPGPTVHVPGPTQTATVNVPGGTQTVKAPGPTATVTESALPSAGPTVTVSASGQDSPSSGTLAPRDPVISFPSINTVPKAVGIGLLATLLLVGLILLALWAGYVMGFKDKERKDNDFSRALLETIRAGKHK